MSLVTRDIRHNCEGRVEKLRRKMAEQQLDGIYLSAGPTMFYFTGFSGCSSGWPIWLTGVVIPKKGPAVAIMNSMHRDIAAYADTWVTDVRIYEDGQDVRPILRQALQDAGLISGRLGSEARLWSAERNLVARAAPQAELIDVQEAIDDLRMIKDELELCLLRKACEASTAGFQACHEAARVGTPGIEVAVAVTTAMIANGTVANPNPGG